MVLRLAFTPWVVPPFADGKFEYSATHVMQLGWAQADYMSDERSMHEMALRRLPLPYSLALRLRDAGVAPEVVCEYVNVDQTVLESMYRIAEAKLLAAHGHLGFH